jgi:hypothetical protein
MVSDVDSFSVLIILPEVVVVDDDDVAFHRSY